MTAVPMALARGTDGPLGTGTLARVVLDADLDVLSLILTVPAADNNGDSPNGGRTDHAEDLTGGVAKGLTNACGRVGGSVLGLVKPALAHEVVVETREVDHCVEVADIHARAHLEGGVAWQRDAVDAGVLRHRGSQRARQGGHRHRADRDRATGDRFRATGCLGRGRVSTTRGQNQDG